MKTEEKVVARIMFQNKIHSSNGQAFEDIFTNIMRYYNSNFRSIKPWGPLGDRKNDGYIKSECKYFQVYAPEDSKTAYMNAVKKSREDFNELIKYWSPVKKYYFVFNDKYKGVHPDIDNELENIKDENSLEEAGVLTAKDLENILFELKDDEILSIAGFIPNPADLKQLEYGVLGEVIQYIMEREVVPFNIPNADLPDWDEKIKFNGLSESVTVQLNAAFILNYLLEEYLSKNGNFLADILRDKMNQVYIQEKENHSGDELFWKMVVDLSPKQQTIYQNTVMVIMAKYFETCDIFEEPNEE